MFEQLLSSVLKKSNKWHLNNHIWSLNLNLRFKPTSFKLLLVALAQINSILPCHDHTSCLGIALIVFLLFADVCSLSVTDGADVVTVDTDEGHYYPQKCQASNPLEHSNTISLSRSCSLLLH
jgi:hypothetical protein